MTVITTRPTRILIDGLEYPGFVRFSGDHARISQDGLMPFQGEVDICHHPDNPRNLDPRIERDTWSFGTEIIIQVKDENNEWVLHPVGKVYYYTSQFDYQTRELKINCGCLIFLLKNRSIDDFKDLDQLVEINDTETNPETGEEETTTRRKYWWEQWNEPGDVRINEVVSEVLSKLGLRRSGSASGRVKTPLTLSGSLLQFIGGLMYKSIRPSFMWCDREGVINIDKLPGRAGAIAIYPGVEEPPLYNDNDYTFNIGGDEGEEVDYKPMFNGIEPIQSLVVTGRWPAKRSLEDEEENEQEEGEEDPVSFCNSYREEGPQLILGTRGASLTGAGDTTLAFGTKCEFYFSYQKQFTETRDEVKAVLFPASSRDRDRFIRSYELDHKQFFRRSDCNIFREEKVIREPIGKIYSGWVSSFPNLNVVFGFAKIFQSDKMGFVTDLEISSIETTTYTYDADGVIAEINTVVQEPTSKILNDFFEFSTEMVVSKQTIERWVKNGNQYNHLKQERTAWQLFDRETLTKTEEYLQSRDSAPSFTVVSSFKREDDDPEPFGFGVPNTVNVNEITEPDPERGIFLVPKLGKEERLSLRTKETKEINSKSGFAQPPKPEQYCTVDEILDDPANNTDQEGGFVEKKWIHKGKLVAPREINDLGDVYEKGVVEAIAEFLYFLKQGESSKQSVTLALPDKMIKNYKPLFTFKVVLPDGQALSFLSNGCIFSIEGNQNIVQLEGYWLGDSQTQAIKSFDNQFLTIR